MNPNIQPNNMSAERPMTSPANPGVRPVGMNPYNNLQQVRPIRMEPPRTVGRNENFEQQNQQPLQSNMQQYQQQNIMQQNQQRQLNMQQQNLRFPKNEDMVRPQTNPGYNPHPNSGIQNNQRGPGAPFNGQRMQMTSQVRPPGLQQQMRVYPNGVYPNYPNGGIPNNQPNLQNYQRMEVPRAPSDQIQANLQNLTHPAQAQISRDPAGNLTRKPSGLDLKPPNLNNQTNNQKSTEGGEKTQTTGQPGDGNGARNDRQPDAGAELTSEVNDSKMAESENSEKIKKTKTKEKSQKDNKNDGIKHEAITSGMVQKNIKFFEDNDTTKTPLTPETVTIKKSKKSTEVPKDVVKSDINKNEYESGVDESPVVHPNLGSIFQVPRKVAKIPLLKGKKRLRKHKTQIHERPAFSVFLKSNYSYVPHKRGGKKIQNIKSYGSKEELLAFFENTKSWRKLNRYGSKADQKLVHKPTTNGDIPTPKKTPSKLQTPSKKNPPLSPTKTPLKSPGTPGTPGAKSLPKTPDSPAPPTPLIKKVPMNKIQVGAAPSPNLKTVRSKVGSLVNTTHKPGGGNVKIESHKIDLSKVQPRTEAKNEMYKPSGGEKKIQQVKLQWSAKSKIGSLENATYKPGGGDKKIESVKLDFKEKAKPKVGSKDNVKHVPGGGNVKIDNQKVEFKAQSKVGSLDNVKHKPGGGDIKIFDDKTYLRQISGNSSEGRASGTQAYSDLSVVREVEGRSAPGTPGRNTSVKIRKITTIENPGESPKIKNITKVKVTSHTPKKERNSEKSPTKQQVKVTYSKISSMKSEESDLPVGIVRLQAKENAPILKPSLGNKDLFDDSDVGMRRRENESSFDNTAVSKYDKTVSNKNVRVTGNIKQNSVSPNLHESKSNRDDSGMSKFLQDELATHEKIGEMWRERNTIEVKPSRYEKGQQRDLSQKYFSDEYEYGSNIRQFRSQNPGTVIETQMNPNESRRLNFHSSQNMQPDQMSLNPNFIQSQQHRQINEQSSFFPP